MNSKERMGLAMKGIQPDRTPLMCQFSLGYLAQYFTNDLIRFWYTPEGLAEAYIAAAEAYGFDGILVSIEGRNPAVMDQIAAVEEKGRGKLITWKNGNRSEIPYNDFPIDYSRTPARYPVDIDELDPDTFGTRTENDLPDYQFNILEYILERKGNELSVHGEVGSSFGRFLKVFGDVANGLMALLDDPEKAKEVMMRMNRDTLISAREQCKRGIHALKISSAYSGAGFISRQMYEEFELPIQKEIIGMVHREFNIPCYIHTCGAIGDRLDLMLETGADGLECLDPPPIGTVDLAEASHFLGNRAFIKGNLDSVNDLRGVTTEQVLEIAAQKLAIGRKHPGGYILSTACSIAPDVPPENIALLRKAVDMDCGI